MTIRAIAATTPLPSSEEIQRLPFSDGGDAQLLIQHHVDGFHIGASRRD